MNSSEATPAATTNGRIKDRIEKAIPDEVQRRGALDLLAYAIENAADERDNAWYLRATPHVLSLYAGRLQACRVGRGKIQLSVMGPVSDEVRAELGAEPEENEAWKAIPGALMLSFHYEKATIALSLLRDPFEKFVDECMARVRRKVGLEYHSPEALAYISSVVGRELPAPSAEDSPEEGEDDDDDDDQEASREPAIRGRAPIFNTAQRSIGSLISEIELKTMALPDLQRPFVWEDSKVRDLLDSLFVGFPVGTIVLWHVADGKEARSIGGPDALKANTLIIDGQQRLTSLYAVMKGVEVTEKDGTKRRIAIAFRPRDGRFHVSDAATSNDPEYLPNVTELWAAGGRTRGAIRRELLKAVAKKRPVDGAYEQAVEENLERAARISEYHFPVVNIEKAAGSEANEEDVAEIFVRINNQGKRLGQADFVLTLLSVFHGPLRDRIELRATEMSKDAVIEIDTQQLLRATCAVGFHRAKMAAIYRFLRGIDPTTGDANVGARQERLERLDRAADECIHPTTWRDYMLRVMHAGIVSESLVSSNSAIVNAYAFYVLGRRVGVPKPKLDELLSRWIFGTQLTARYSGSSETVFEKDLARVNTLGEGDGERFVAALDDAMAEQITGDYWTHALLGSLDTQRGRAPAALAFRAAQVILGARALFSDQPLHNLLAPPGKGKRSAREVHHLFPQAWLVARGIKERRRIHQVANLADVGWYENNTIGAQGPGEYVPRLRDELGLTDERWGRVCAEHALPLGWETMDYDTFLRERRQRMADVTRVAFRQLGGEADSAPIAPPWFLPNAEAIWKQIVATERALRGVVREVYSKKFGDGAAKRIEEAVPPAARETLQRALRARPSGADPLSIVDYMYLAQLPPLLFANDVWVDARERLGGAADLKQRLAGAIQEITPVRNEIAHVREIPAERLKRADVACDELLRILRP